MEALIKWSFGKWGFGDGVLGLMEKKEETSSLVTDRSLPNPRHPDLEKNPSRAPAMIVEGLLRWV